MDIAMNNACIVYNQILKITDCKSKEVSNLDFRQEVAMRLIEVIVIGPALLHHL